MSLNQTIPKVSELQALVATAIRACKFMTDNELSVVEDRGLEDKKIERMLRTKGFVIVVAPLLGASLQDQSGPAWIFKCDILVSLRMNPEVNGDKKNGAGVDIYNAWPAVMDALCMRDRHPGGEFFKAQQQAVTISKFDEGLWIYDLMFTKEALA